MRVSTAEQALGLFLRDLPKQHGYRYTEESARLLRRRLFESLAGDDQRNLPFFFPQGPPLDASTPWSLRKAQGAVEGAEYTAAARGRPCGHIFRTGESTYHCKTCAADDTCVLCARCFAQSDHEGHMVYISVSPGNSGCCDCADDEAWVRPVHCTIHKAHTGHESRASGKTKQPAALPDELREVIRMTIGRALDYMCDVISCSPEQLRIPKTQESVERDEVMSRLTSQRYGGPEPQGHEAEEVEYSLVLWNDEKHTADDVQNQVARACGTTKKFGLEKAYEVDSYGRSVVAYSTNLKELLRQAEIIEQIKLTVTVRSARDTFREQMCHTVVDWLADICGCSVGFDPHILRNTICQELLGAWHVGSTRNNAAIGQAGLHDHEFEDQEWVREREDFARFLRPLIRVGVNVTPNDNDAADDDEEEEEGEGEEDEDVVLGDAGDDVRTLIGDVMDLDNADPDIRSDRQRHDDMDMDDDIDDTANEASEATLAGYPAPPPPPSGPATDPGRLRNAELSDLHSNRPSTPNESDDGEASTGSYEAMRRSVHPQVQLPKTPRTPGSKSRRLHALNHWLELPDGFERHADLPLAENLYQRVRLDYLVLYDMRLWKTLRINLRHLFIATVVTVPEFKRLLGLRFAGLYTMLAQLYLIGDREPDHSIINLSVQILTTPSITAEVVDRANFLTNLLAILYTFLTTRQVGYPADVSPQATLAFDVGAVTNRRMFHFFNDTRYMLQSAFVQEKVRTEPRYLLQFLDLVKLHQGLCPNVRAVGEHVEYETDTWIHASMIIKEVNRLCRQMSEAFALPATGHDGSVARAIRDCALAALTNSLGMDRKRFVTAEIKRETRFRRFDFDSVHPSTYILPDFCVIREPMSFHHPLHYLLSWLLEAGKSMSSIKVREILNFEPSDLPVPALVAFEGRLANLQTQGMHSGELLSVLFDHPLRVCAWLAQMRAGMWVRNGMTLRHQMHTYRGTSQRDVSFQRDLFMLQAGFVLCSTPSEPVGERFLAQMLTRFDMVGWAAGQTDTLPGYEESQQVDVVEDFFHLLIILLSERHALLPTSTSAETHKRSLQRDIAHVLCFKPLSFSDISTRLTDRVADSEEFDAVLDEMTNFRAPEGLSDSGTFELHPQYVELVDPYYAFYTRNQREEAENLYREHVAKKTGKVASDIVFEANLPDIPAGLFQDLPAFTRTPLFAQTIFWTLEFACPPTSIRRSTPVSRLEPLLHVVLHLVLLAIKEDCSEERVENPRGPGMTFVDYSMTMTTKSSGHSILGVLQTMLSQDTYSACHAKIRLINLRLAQKRPREYARASAQLPSQVVIESKPPASGEDRELRKKQALERQARVMAQFKEQQTSFMETQGLDWGDEGLSDGDNDTDMATGISDLHSAEKTREYPSEPCMLCQESTNDERLFGTFAFMSQSRILRQTDITSAAAVADVIDTPRNLDRSAEAIRPFGIATPKVLSQVHTTEPVKHRPQAPHYEGPVATSCGHIMHFSCFEAYLAATDRRHSHQIQRNHPERPRHNEFLCPLCKALGNTFLPIIWKDKKESYPGILASSELTFDDWLKQGIDRHLARSIEPERARVVANPADLPYKGFRKYVHESFVPPLTTPGSMYSFVKSETAHSSPPPPASEAERGHSALSLSALLNFRLEERRSSQSQSASSGAQATPADELVRAYERISDSMIYNLIASQAMRVNNPSTKVFVEPICNALAFSISSVEIAHRGVDSFPTCLSSISDQSLTHLRILSETASSYLAVAGLQGYLAKKLIDVQEHYLDALTIDDTHNIHTVAEKHARLFDNDMFVFYATTSVLMSSAWPTCGHHMLRLCYMAEIIKVILTFADPAYVRVLGTGQSMASQEPRTMDPAFPELVHFITETCNDAVYSRRPFGFSSEYGLSEHSCKALQPIVEAHALTFLRKALILMHVRSGVDFAAAEAAVDPSAPELDRLANLLQLPPLAGMMEHFLSDSRSGRAFQALATTWIRQVAASPGGQLRGPKLSHPAIFELVRLPRTYDMLTEEAIKRRCPTTGKEVSDPVVCLFCGEIFCSQAQCCMVDRSKGGCNQHLKKCGGNIGIFINIRKCMVLFLHNSHGSWAHAPYLDRHGEVDPTLRRHHQLFLNQRRYDKLLRDVWLGHGVPSAISRRLEGDINTGGWETL